MTIGDDPQALEAYRIENERDIVVQEALSWEHTAYHPRAQVKIKRADDGTIIDAGGCDCATFIYCVFVGVGFIPPFELPEYPADWHLHRKTEMYFNKVIEHAHVIQEAEALPGDVVMYKNGHSFSHSAIIITPGWPNIIHADAGARKVIRGLGDQGRMQGLERIFVTKW